MLNRFTGPDGRRLLTEALRAQKIVAGSESIAEALADALDLKALQPGDALITQGHTDNDLYLVLSGTVSVLVNGRPVAERTAGTHVGEMSLIDPAAWRSATVRASSQAVVGKVPEAAFTSLADRHPRLWRALAVEMGDRLRQRGRFLRPPNPKPIVFLGSSREALPVASMLRDGLSSPEVEVRLWTDGVFGASRFPMEDLERQLDEADFAVLVVAADDRVTSRKKDHDAPRDNVVFELGLFMGALTRARTFMAVPRGVDLKIPSDILGLTPVAYETTTGAVDVTSACAELQVCIRRMGPR
ncbi:MAG TPA: TIR domain-containing protein [Polyangia bacterium]|nr:TIR domain-containing protein [Polyangia bacterium]